MTGYRRTRASCLAPRLGNWNCDWYLANCSTDVACGRDCKGNWATHGQLRKRVVVVDGKKEEDEKGELVTT